MTKLLVLCSLCKAVSINLPSKGEMSMKVLVSDPLAEVGIRIFKEAPGIELDINPGLTHEELKKLSANTMGWQ